MFFQAQVGKFMNTHTRNSGLPEMPGNKVLVLDAETGTAQDPASVHDHVSYRRYLMMRASSAGGKEESPEQEAPAKKAGQ